MLFKNITILDENYEIRENRYVGTEDDRIAYIGTEMPETDFGEIYDGNPPYTPNGCISQAWSVGEILRSMALLEKFCKDDR